MTYQTDLKELYSYVEKATPEAFTKEEVKEFIKLGYLKGRQSLSSPNGQGASNK